MIAYLDRRQWL